MTKWAKILLAIILMDIAITSLGATFIGPEYMSSFEFNPLMLWLLSQSVLLFASVKLLWSCLCIKAISLASCSEKIYKYVSIAYAVVLISSIAVDLFFLPK